MVDQLDSGFPARHIGITDADRAHMLEALGLASLDELADRAVPANIRSSAPPELPAPITEQAALEALQGLAAMNNPMTAMIGLGYYGTVTPPVIRRNVVENPAWYTAYTPYQPEISQGRLEALLNFQTMISDLTGLPTAGASLLDEGTAVAEAILLARRQTKKGSVVVIDGDIFPQSLAVVQTRCRAMGIDIVVAEGSLVEALQTNEAFAVVVQTPGASGRVAPVSELREVADKAHENNALVVAACDLLALTVTEAVAEWGADVAVGSSQRFGVPLFFGGPHAGFISVRKGLERALPGRLVGVSKDADGAAAYRLALQTREQHIRREKATSNICTAQVLLAVCAAMYGVYHGPIGLTGIANTVHENARRLAASAKAAGLDLVHDSFFDTIQVSAPGKAAGIVEQARAQGVHLRLVDDDTVGVSVGEDAREEDLAAVCAAFGTTLGTDTHGDLAGQSRTTEFMTHPVFNTYHSETQMLRYLRTLADRDFALDRGMIPLGSCTMKLNAVAEMEAMTYPGFANLHPFAPPSDAEGYIALISSLEEWLASVTGYARVSIQPNAGSQGEFAGLLAIRAYHKANGDDQRTICLIPASAHGTNAASAHMAGMKVVVVKTATDGTVDMDDLDAKIEKHREELAAIMVTYPSTHGVYEERIVEVCDKIHEAGGQVYIDGANFNALLGLAQPGQFGGDVSHLNLHKTFCIPHGGGGPGVGPVAVGEHLAPYLPNHPLWDEAGPESGVGPVSAAPFGSAGIMSISWTYIAMMGASGLTQATLNAVLAANYIAKRLGEHYPVLYTGANDLVAHECILDLRGITKESGITVDDVAKRLIDYGFHAPTMSFPVSGTLMVEPTESESLAEIDRFCDAMIAIRQEIQQVVAGEWPADDNPLHNAPHTLARVTADEWDHPYSRTLAAYPAGRHIGPIAGSGQDKYWPAVARVEQAYGDRNLICSCPPIEAYAE
ncbi:aminomethyl-transferring glycine dehydrogenase [Ammonicoccus fulvus]|uniref:Glycine dehydrogenase (decarboxylating) n=1 Tax=Ammonicoccus fulvus TaxID=3138240 RepID=A0ABZ3FRM3_9ACTN